MAALAVPLILLAMVVLLGAASRLERWAQAGGSPAVSPDVHNPPAAVTESAVLRPPRAA